MIEVDVLTFLIFYVGLGILTLCCNILMDYLERHGGDDE